MILIKDIQDFTIAFSDMHVMHRNVPWQLAMLLLLPTSILILQLNKLKAQPKLLQL
jgi:hypothetical protein